MINIKNHYRVAIHFLNPSAQSLIGLKEIRRLLIHPKQRRAFFLWH